MPLRAIAAVIRRGDQVLLCRRPGHKRHGEKWEFPGGKTRPGESILAALQRELNEELGVEVRSVGGNQISLPDPGSNYSVEFVPTDILGEPRPLEHAAIEWVRLDQVEGYDLAPADDLFARQHLRSLLDL